MKPHLFLAAKAAARAPCAKIRKALAFASGKTKSLHAKAEAVRKGLEREHMLLLLFVETAAIAQALAMVFPQVPSWLGIIAIYLTIAGAIKELVNG